MLFQRGDDTFPREILGSLKGHVFQEVGQTVLFIVFEQGSGITYDVETRSAFGFFIVTQVIHYTVGELSRYNIRILRKRGLKIDLCKTSLQEYKQENVIKINSLFIVKFL